MLSKLRILALGSTALVCASAWAQTPPPSADNPPQPAVFDLKQLPAFKGTLQQFTLTPRGDIDGMILADGTEVKVAPHLTGELASAVKIGDAITIRGLRAASLPLVAASSVINDATGRAVIDNGAPAGPPIKGPPDRAFDEGMPTDVQGRVKAALHGRMGEINGALLGDGTILRLPPPEADRFASLLAPAQTVAVRGTLRSNSFGKVLVVRALGSSPDQLSEILGPPDGGKKGHPKGPKGEKRDPLPSATIQGKVSRYLITPMGDVEGLLLDSGMVTRLPPHMGKELAQAIKVGDLVSVEGVREEVGSSFRAYSITNTQSKVSVVRRERKWSDAKMPGAVRSLGLKELTASGAVQTVLTGPRGEPQGVILDNGFVVRFGREAIYAASAQMRVGARMAAKGYGTENEYGRALDATAIGETPDSMKAIVR